MSWEDVRSACKYGFYDSFEGDICRKKGVIKPSMNCVDCKLFRDEASEDYLGIRREDSKCKQAMDKIQEMFREMTRDNMELIIFYNAQDKRLAGSEDEITLMIKDKETKEHRGINLTYYFEKNNIATRNPISFR